MLETCFCLEEDFAGVLVTEPITPSTGGVAGDLDVVRSDDGLGALGDTSYNVKIVNRQGLNTRHVRWLVPE